MVYSSKVTIKGQVTIPIELRKVLKLKPSDKVIFGFEENKITLRKSRTAKDLAGMLKSKVKIKDDREYSKFIEEARLEKYKKLLKKGE